MALLLMPENYNERKANSREFEATLDNLRFAFATQDTPNRLAKCISCLAITEASTSLERRLLVYAIVRCPSLVPQPTSAASLIR